MFLLLAALQKDLQVHPPGTESLYSTRVVDAVLNGSRTFRTIDVCPPPPRRFAPIFKTFRPRRRDDLPQFKTFRPPVRRFAPTEDVSPPVWDVSLPIETFRPLGKTFCPPPLGKMFRPLSKLRHFAPPCETFRPLSYRTFRTLGKSFRPRFHRTFRTLEKTFRPLPKLRYLAPIYLNVTT